MTGALGALYVIAVLLVGCAVWGAVRGRERDDWATTFGTIIALGLGSLGTVLFFVSMVGIVPSRALIATIAGIAAIATVWWWRRASIEWPVFSAPKGGLFEWPWLLPLLGIVFGAVVWSATAWGLPLWEWDSFVIWGLKSKVVYHDALVPRPRYFTDLSLSFSHPNYPLLTPFLTAGAWTVAGEVREEAGKAHLPLFYVSMMFLTFSAARPTLGTFAGASLALVVAASPILLLYGGVGGADVPLTAFHLAGAFWVIRWLQSGRITDAALAGAFAGFCALTKQEGLAIAFVQSAVVGGVALMRLRTHWKSAVLSIGVVAVLTIPWLIYRAGIPDTAVPYAGRLNLATIAENLSRLKPILSAMFGQMIAFDIFGAFWIVWILMCVAGFAGFAKKENLAMWAIFLGHVGVKVLAYVITTWDIEDHLINSVSRVMMHTMGAAIILTVAHASALLDRLNALQQSRASQAATGGAP
jgi:hypothetical protein